MGYIIMYVYVQEVCYQYWPSSGSQTYGEFTVELVGEDKQNNDNNHKCAQIHLLVNRCWTRLVQDQRK